MNGGTAVLSAAVPALYLGALWYASGLLTVESDDWAGRLRGMLAIGVFTPLVLASLGILNGVTCALAVASFVLLRAWRFASFARVPTRTPEQRRGRRWPASVAVATLLVSWPQIVRPLLDNDSLTYHLPNAASWVVGGTLWTTVTTYWWYPGGSELFAAGLLAVGGPAALSVAGFPVLLLLGQRTYALARAHDLSPQAAAAIASALVATPVFALQAGSLQNDVWIAAWTLEIVWALSYERRWTIAATWVTTLIKPVGFAFASIPHVTSRPNVRRTLLSFAMIAAWFGRDALLAPHAVVHRNPGSAGMLVASTIVAQGFVGIAVLAAATFRAGPGFFVLALLSLLTIGAARDVRLRVATALAWAIFLVEPFAFADSMPQLASGQSLRYLTPALVLGLCGALPFLRAAPMATTVAGALLTIAGATTVLRIFWNDVATHDAVAVTLVTGMLVLIATSVKRGAGVASSLVALALLAYATHRAGAAPDRYLADLYRTDGRPSGVFAWLRAHAPRAVMGDGFDLGTVTLVAPRTTVLDATDDPCASARAAGAMLVTAPGRAPNAGARKRLDDLVATCGRVVYRDAAVVVMLP